MRAMRNAGPNVLRHVSIVLSGTLAAVIPLQIARADVEGEREQLARVIHELQALEPLLRAAESQGNPDARVRFRYDWLRQDLQRMRLGIQEHINAPRAQPRSFPPLRGDYRR
ncbi:MAG: RAQPRD family integrative conjugative element protein [Pseudomonadota bacterium]|nr:RAQPRD family integrative conjugative element protein [Pseudomonadota bacterium]